MATNKTDQPRRLLLGKIATAHGIKGLVKLIIYADDPHTLEKYRPLYTDEAGNKTLALTLKNPMGKYWLAAVKGITDRNQAEALRGTELWLDRDHLPEPEDGEYYHVDLIGLHAEDKNGINIGTVIGVSNFGAGDLLEIKPPKGISFYLTLTKENVLDILLEDGKVIVEIPDGWR